MSIAQRLFDRLFVELKLRSYKDIEGFLRPHEAATLYRIARGLPPASTIVEIGSWKGKSTYCLALGLRDGQVIAIDPFDASGETGSQEIYAAAKGGGPLLLQFKSQMERLHVMQKLKILEGYSQQFVGQIPKIDFLFIDGNHSKEGCDFDFMNYTPFIPIGGYLALHDYYPTKPDLGPTWVIQHRILSSNQYAPVGLYLSLWVGRKVA